jgi:RAT1-interacting protein
VSLAYLRENDNPHYITTFDTFPLIFASMTSRKRAISNVDLNQPLARRQPRLDHSLSPPPHVSSTLPYPSTSQSASRAVPFQRPLPLISFSYTNGHKLEFSDAAMRYYVNPPPGADLGHGYERWIRRPEERGRLDGLLRAISEIRRRGTSDPVINIVSWRGVMTKCVPSNCPHALCLALPARENPDCAL